MMNKLISLLLAIVCIFSVYGACAEITEEDIANMDTTMPVNDLIDPEDFSDEGGEGVVLFVEGEPDTGTEPDDDSDNDAVIVEGFIPDGMEKVIIGKDNRTTVKNTKKYPFSAIANMIVTGECGETWTGTGFMVGRNCLLTAAPCMICPEHGKWAKKVTLYFGYQNKKNYLYKYTGGWKARAGTSFPNRRYDFNAMQDDWCYLILDKKVGDKTGRFGLNCASKQISKRKSKAAGYRSNILKYGNGKAKMYNKKLITYNNDTLPGNSGGPIYTSKNYVEAIIIAENKFTLTNWGRRITSDIWTRMYKDGYK